LEEDAKAVRQPQRIESSTDGGWEEGSH